jgi:hypothetical protein
VLLEADVVLLASDVVLLEADVVLLEADVVLLEADVLLLEADVVLLASDVVLLEADVVLLASDVVLLASDVVLLASDVVLLVSDVLLLVSDVVLLVSDVLLLEADVLLLEAALGGGWTGRDGAAWGRSSPAPRPAATRPGPAPAQRAAATLPPLRGRTVGDPERSASWGTPLAEAPDTVHESHPVSAVVVVFLTALACAVLPACLQSPEADATASSPTEQASEPRGPEPTGEAPQPMEVTGGDYESRDFPFVVQVKDDGEGPAGGWQRSVTTLGFLVTDVISLRVLYRWQCPIEIGMPIRSEAQGKITSSRASLWTVEVAQPFTGGAELGGRVLPYVIICDHM